MEKMTLMDLARYLKENEPDSSVCLGVLLFPDKKAIVLRCTDGGFPEIYLEDDDDTE